VQILDFRSECHEPDGKSRIRLELLENTPSLRLADATARRAVCGKLPGNIDGVEILWSMNGWPQANRNKILSPSLQYYDGEGKLIEEMLTPARTQTRVGGYSFTMHHLTAMRGHLSAARYVVIYIDPAQLEGSTRAADAFGVREIPHTDTGTIEILLH